jgi:hypothetical protein
MLCGFPKGEVRQIDELLASENAGQKRVFLSSVSPTERENIRCLNIGMYMLLLIPLRELGKYRRPGDFLIADSTPI